MPIEAGTWTCSVCGGVVGEGDGQCPSCHLDAVWLDMIAAAVWAGQFLDNCRARGVLPAETATGLQKYFQDIQKLWTADAKARDGFRAEVGLASPGQCVCCHSELAGASHCLTCGVPAGIAAQAPIRYSNFARLQVDTLRQSGLVTLAQAHAFGADAVAHATAMLAGLRRQQLSAVALAALRMTTLNQAHSTDQMRGGHGAEGGEGTDAKALGGGEDRNGVRMPPPLPVQKAGPASTHGPGASPWVAAGAGKSGTRPPRRGLMEILLDPRSIQWLLATGGVLLAVGLVILLASLGVFKDPRVVAVLLGAGTLAVMAAGVLVIHFSRYQVAGKAATLLGCLIMPLNLWFYHAHHLMTLSGHLWVAAAFCCALYATTAWILADSTFVYVLMAGVAGTGLLILADARCLAEIARPSTLLVVLALLALHAERVFPDDEKTPFSRKRFGMAFFWCAQGLMAAGLAILLVAQLVGWMHGPLGALMMIPAPDIANEANHGLRMWALILVLAGTYAYVYSDVVVRRVGRYVYLAAFTLLWAEVLALDVLRLRLEPHTTIVLLSLTALAVNLLYRIAAGISARVGRPLPALGLLLSLVPVVYGVTLHLRATEAALHQYWPFSATWHYVLSMLLAAVVCRVGAHLYRRGQPGLVAGYFFGSAASLLVAGAAALATLGLAAWDQQAPVLALIPIAYLMACHLYRRKAFEKPLEQVAHAAMVVMIVSVVCSAFQITERVVTPISQQRTNLLLAVFCAEAAVFYALCATLRRAPWGVYMGTLAACGSLWQFLNYFNVPAEYHIALFAVLGLGLLVAYNLALVERFASPHLAGPAFRCGNALLSIAAFAAVLMSLSHLVIGRILKPDMVLDAALALAAIAAAAMVRDALCRRWHISLAIILGTVDCLVVHRWLDLGLGRSVETFLVAVGLLLLGWGHVGWYREQDQRSDTVSFTIGLGSLLAGTPLLIAALAQRFFYDISTIDEISLLTVSVLMLVSGVILRIRSTTLTGGVLLALHLLMLMVSLGMHAQLAIGVYLAIGGAVLFAMGIVLSVCRERLLALPRAIQARQGMFKVLNWR